MVKVKYNLKFPTSVYAALEIENKLYVGGSDWDRRKILYSKKIAEKSKGVLHILEKKKSEYVKNKHIIFPSMVYTILPLFNSTFFVGCKSKNKAFNLLSNEGEILIQRDDNVGDGAYNSVFDKEHNEIILTTRLGKLEIINSKNLELKSHTQIAPKKTRLWSIDYDIKNNKIYLGDYAGNLYILQNKRLIKKISFNKDKKTEFGPSLWGLKLVQNKIVLGNRQGSILILNKKDLTPQKEIKIMEDISCIEKIHNDEILIGTRYGKLFSLNLKNYKLKKVIEIKPSLQKENAVWGMNKIKDGVLVCFADGNVCKIS